MAGLRVLRDDLMQHMQLENDILFAGLNEPPTGRAGAFMSE